MGWPEQVGRAAGLLTFFVGRMIGHITPSNRRRGSEPPVLLLTGPRYLDRYPLAETLLEKVSRWIGEVLLHNGYSISILGGLKGEPDRFALVDHDKTIEEFYADPVEETPRVHKVLIIAACRDERLEYVITKESALYNYGVEEGMVVLLLDEAGPVTGNQLSSSPHS